MLGALGSHTAGVRGAIPQWLCPQGGQRGASVVRRGGAGDLRGQEGKGVELQLGALGAVITRCWGCHAGWDFPPLEDKATGEWPL